MIPYGRQDINQQDIEAVVGVLRSDFLTQGPVVPRFETEIAGYCGAEYGVALNSATSALHVACLALGLGPGDILWTSPISFVASANCAIYCGAQVDFVDIDPNTYNMSVEALESKLISAEIKGQLPKIVIPVHLSGQSCEMELIHKLAKKYKFKIIEDASHAVGGTYKNQLIGNCRYSDVTVFSFHPVKIITTAEGGMALTNQADLAEKMALLRSHGITREPGKMDREPDGPWYYQQIDLGFNYRMTELQAALGCSQLERLNEFVLKRQMLSKQYNALLNDLPIIIPYQHSDTLSSYHLYIIRLKKDEVQRSHKEVFTALRAANIGVNLHYIPIHTQPFYQNLGFTAGDFPQAMSYYAEAISLPLFPGLTNADQQIIVEQLKQAILSS